MHYILPTVEIYVGILLWRFMTVMG